MRTPSALQNRFRALPRVAAVAAAAFLTIAPIAPASGAELALDDAIVAAIDRSYLLEQSRLRTAVAETRVDATAQATDPRLTLESQPLYALNTQRGSNFADVTSPLDFPPDPTTTVNNSTGVELGVQQPLPTAGVLSGNVGTSLSASTSVPDEGDSTTTWSFQPSVSVAFSQPLFVDGRFVDNEEPFLVLEQAQRGAAESRVSEEQIRQQLATSVTRLYVQLDSLRRAMGLQRTQRSLLELQLEQARIRSEQGQGSRQETFTLQVQLNRSEDAMLQTRLSAREVELELARLTGVDVDESTTLTGMDEARERLAVVDFEQPSANAELRAAQIAVERAEADLRLARKQERATASASLALTPRYMDNREDPDTLGGAFGDYFGDGGGVDVAFSLGMSVPLGEGARREREVRQAELALEIARLEVDRIVREQEAQLSVVRARLRILEERAELLSFEIEYERDQLESEQELVGIGASTELQVEQIRTNIAARENELADLETQLLLERLQAATIANEEPVALLTGAARE
ncbi:MAG: TolC family protein [Spirochaetota bacterium]